VPPAGFELAELPAAHKAALKSYVSERPASYLVQLTPYILPWRGPRGRPTRPCNPQCVRGRIVQPVACVSCNGEAFLLGVVVTDLDTEHGGTGANKRDGARQVGRLSVADLDL
jgi:hypothetical protein